MLLPTAIYGSRASNGVIIITTKKGSNEKIKVSFNTTNSIQTRTKLADMLSRDEFVDVLTRTEPLLRSHCWGMRVPIGTIRFYQSAFGTDNNLSLSGKIAKDFPVRASGYYKPEGILKTDKAERFTGSLSVSLRSLTVTWKLIWMRKGLLTTTVLAKREPSGLHLHSTLLCPFIRETLILRWILWNTR